MRTYSVYNPFHKPPYVVDPSSCFRPGDPVAKHLLLDLEVNFKSSTVNGRAHLTFDKPGEAALDFTGDVLSVLTEEFGDSRVHPLKFIRDYAGSIKGLVVEVPADGKMMINYTTKPDAAGLHWMDARQTASKQPMVMSQNQSIGARSWIPCQDTPQVKFTWEANVHVSADMHVSVLMSDGSNDCIRSAAYCTPELDAFMFRRQEKPVPAYLIWLVVGQFEMREVEDVALFAEGTMIDRYATELVACQIGRLVNAAREMFGELVWGSQFAVFVPPASFPYGGMENPACVVVTPTVMDGRGSSGYVILHELAHTWFGNMVTCATWSDLWLNEAWATWAELRLVKAVYGHDVAAQLYHVNQREQRQAILRATKSPVQKPVMQIAPKLKGVHPDDAPQTLAYHGGAAVLFDLEACVGQQAFMRFALGYLQRYRFQAITTELFAQYVADQFGDQVANRMVGRRLAEFVASEPDFPLARRYQPMSNGVQAVRDACRSDELPRAQWLQWSAMQRLMYLHGLGEQMLACAMSVLELPHDGNDEVLGTQLEVWVRACAAQNANVVRYHTPMCEMKAYLLRVGRMKFAKPIFHALMAMPDGAAIAKNIFNDASPSMSSQWTRAVRQIVHPPAAGGTPITGA